MDKRKEAFRLYVQEGMPCRAIAQVLGVPLNTVYTWIARERKARENPRPERAKPERTETRSVKGNGRDERTPSVKGPPETGVKVLQDALCPPPPDKYGRPYISLIPGGAFARWVPCPRCNRPWPNPRWNERDTGRRLVVGDMGGDDPRSRLSLYLLCKSCAEAGPRGEMTYLQIIPVWKGGQCVDCQRSRYGTAIFEFVDCSDGRMRCLEHAVRWWEYAGQVDPAETPQQCVDCGQTQNLYWSEDGRVRCAKCRLRIWQRAREGQGLPFGL
jgi:DNA-directed RNA polymerase subunit RPC12/RpoP